MAVILTGTEYIEVADSASVRSPSTAITIAAWVRAPAAGGDDFAAVVIKRVTSGSFVSYSVQRDDPRRYYHAASDGTTYRDSGLAAAVAADTWFFIVGRWESGGQQLIEAYDTGGSVAASSSGGNQTFTIGYEATDLVFGLNNTAFFVGRIAGVYIHDARLTNGQVGALLDDTVSLTTDSGFTAPAITPSAGFWPLDFDARDVSGNGNHGTPVNDPMFTGTGTPEVTTSIPLTLDVAATTQAQHQVAATVALTVGIAPQAAVQHSATAAIPLELALTPVADDGEEPATPASRTFTVQAEGRAFSVLTEDRSFEVAARVEEVRRHMSDTRLSGGQKKRDPQDVLDYVWDWSAWLPDGDTISSFSVIVDDDSGTPLVEDSSSNDDTTVTVWLSGGTLKTYPSVTVRIVTAQARTADATKRFEVVSL